MTGGMNVRTLLSVVLLGLPLAAIGCGGSVEGAGNKSPSPGPAEPDSGIPVPECSGVGQGCAGGEAPGQDCTVVEQCVNGTWQCETVCADPPPPPGCSDEVIDCGGSIDGCWSSAQCVAGNWTCVESCEAGPPGCACASGDQDCGCDAGAPFDSGPVCGIDAGLCFCPEGDNNCGAPAPDAGCSCPANEPGCVCVTAG